MLGDDHGSQVRDPVQGSKRREVLGSFEFQELRNELRSVQACLSRLTIVVGAQVKGFEAQERFLVELRDFAQSVLLPLAAEKRKLRPREADDFSQRSLFGGPAR